jgi:Sec-independent protein secretion pathway component TatC
VGTSEVLAAIAGLSGIALILTPFVPISGVASGTTIMVLLALGLSVYALAQISELNDQLRVLREEKVRGD